MFSKAVPARTIRLFGEELVFPSCYFIESYTKTFFQGKISALGENIERELRALDVAKDKIELHLRPVTVTDGMDGDKPILAWTIWRCGASTARRHVQGYSLTDLA